MISAYLKLSSEKSGEIRGPVRDRDSEKNGSIALLTIDHSIVSPRDLATGMASGKRQHSPLTFTKEPDNTSPAFYQLLSQNEPIAKAEIFFYGFGTQGGFNADRETNLYKITLAKAFVSKIELAGHMDEAAKEGQRLPLTESISLVYDSILWEWKETPRAEAQDLFSSGAS